MPRGGLTSGSGYNGHNSDGRHKNDPSKGRGNPVGKGRPEGAKDSVPRGSPGQGESGASEQARAYSQSEFESFFTAAKRRKVLNQLQKQAEKGHYKSAELLLAYDMGKPAVATEQSEGEGMTAEQTRALAEQVKLHLLTKDGKVVEGEPEGDERSG